MRFGWVLIDFVGFGLILIIVYEFGWILMDFDGLRDPAGKNGQDEQN